MKFTVNVNKFRNHVNSVIPVIGKSILPILNNVMISADGKNVRLCAANLAQTITTGFECDSTPGCCTVPARKLLSILSGLPQEEDVEFVADDKKSVAELSVPSGKFTLLGASVNDFPEIPTIPAVPQAVVPAETVTAMIELCQNAVQKDNARPQLAGMYLHFTSDTTCAVATDGKRMAIYSVPANNDSNLGGYIIPTIALGMISKLTGDLQFAVADNVLIVQGDNMTITTKLISGTYPNYSMVIPKEFKETVAVNSELLQNAVKLVSTVTDVNQSINLVFDADNIRLSADNSSIGSAIQQIPVEHGTSTPLEVTINPVFLLNAIGNYKGDVTIKLNDPLWPLQVNTSEEATTIIMPLRRK